MALIKDDLIKTIAEEENTLLKCMMIVTATELCGSFLTGKTGPHSTRDNFLAFWKSKYMPKEYNGISELLYDILRNGVSHSFIAKGGVIPSREKKSAHKHLRYFKQGIFIYADKLGEDVTGGLVMYLEDKKNNPELNQKYNNVLKELIQDGESKYDKFITRNKIQVSIEPIIGDIYPDI